MWGEIERNSLVFDACLRAVEHESATLVVFEQKRAAVAIALSLCENEMKDIGLRPLLINMGNLDDYEGVGVAGHRKIDIAGPDAALGQRYRRGIVEYFGISNVGDFLRHVETPRLISRRRTLAEHSALEF